MIVLGVSAFYHDSACALAIDGKIVAAAQEERFTRRRFDADAPLHAYRYCLDEAGISPADVDVVAYYENPRTKLGRQLWMEFGAVPGDGPLPWMDATMPERQLRDRLGFEAPFEVVGHHESHAASAFYWSGFDRAALFTADAVGEWATTTYGEGNAEGIHLGHQVDFPHSLGLFYSAITAFLGFAVNSDEYKVMGLAAYGSPRYVEHLSEVIDAGTGGNFTLNTRYTQFVSGKPMFTEELADLVGFAPRTPEGIITANEQDLARSAQVVLEGLLLSELRFLAERVDSENVCYAGGVALNCVANHRLRKKSPFRKWYIPPAPGDAGGAVGAALLVGHRSGTDGRFARISDANLGPTPGDLALRRTLDAAQVSWSDFTGRTDDLVRTVAGELADGQVVGWCRGRMEFGPRALGARSILADPRSAEMRDTVNRLVKKREEFRPFAPAVPVERVSEFFDTTDASPFMLETVSVRTGTPLAAVTHVDGSARVQTVAASDAPVFHELLTAFGDLTGVPVLLNTSFNVRGEPIVCDDLDALMCFVRAGIDVLVCGDVLVRREALPPHWQDAVRVAADVYGSAPAEVSDAYSFFA